MLYITFSFNSESTCQISDNISELRHVQYVTDKFVSGFLQPFRAKHNFYFLKPAHLIGVYPPAFFFRILDERKFLSQIRFHILNSWAYFTAHQLWNLSGRFLSWDSLTLFSGRKRPFNHWTGSSQKKGMGKLSQFPRGEKEEESLIIYEETSLKFLDFTNLTLRCD